MTEYFTHDESRQLKTLTSQLLRLTRETAHGDDFRRVRDIMSRAVATGHLLRPATGLNRVIMSLSTARDLATMVSPDRNMCLTILLEPLVAEGFIDEETVAREWNSDIARMVHGRLKVADLYGRHSKVETENFRNLLLTFAEDIRVIIIMIVDRLTLMRAINHHPDEQFVRDTANESSYLYAPLAHRLGLYKIKSDLEDLSLKYTNREIYTRIAHGLNAKKAIRDAYIADFIAPIKARLEAEGLKFSIKGRTKSIYSIWNKLRKQQIEMKDVFDLFAIRIILDVAPEKEKAECWNVYSIVADMYTPNPARLKDWLSIPKSNGYESLHTTVKGPDNKWVEVQIRSRRMDLVAEKGLAAHWRYKGIKSEGGLDQWMNNIRDILEAPAGSDPMELMKDMRMDVYDKEVFVFTPKGDLYKLPLGATVLDFAFQVHSKLGCICTGGRVNGRNRKINFRLQSGDTVEILTASNQTPKADWLNFVVTSKARAKIRQTIKERENRTAEIGRETLQRRCKNRKLDIVESIMMRLIRKLGYKTATAFYSAIGDEGLAPTDVIVEYEKLVSKEEEAGSAARSADEFELQQNQGDDESASGNDVIIIGENIKGINYRLARCCNPINGDKVFGFISAEGVIKVHRCDCPNATALRSRYPYRIITTRWAGSLAGGFAATLRVVGHDDIGIVTNISSIINKEPNVALRNISIESYDGLFRGYLVVGVDNTASLDNLIRKIKTVKGIKDVQRNN